MSLESQAHKTWTRDGFIISTDPSLVDLQSVNAVFDSDLIYWGKKLPLPQLKVMVEKSVNFGIYSPTASALPANHDSDAPDSAQTPEHRQISMIGYARIITDYVTIAYLTDVYVLKEWQGQGLSNWLMECVKEWLETVPNMRRIALVVKEGKAEEYYAKVLGSRREEDKGQGYRIVSATGGGSTFGNKET